MGDEEEFTTEGTEDTEGDNAITKAVIGCAIRVHQELGPGLLESAYQSCLAFELARQRIPFEQRVKLPVVYRGHAVDCGYEMDLLVADKVIIEIKAVDRIHPIHKAQLLSYLRLANRRVGLLINFHVERLYEGVTRLIND